MVLRVKEVAGELHVILTPEAVHALNLREGSAVAVEPVATDAKPVEHSYVSVEEGLESFRRTEPFHRHTYTELAK